jgi:hypothetical protein
MLPRVLAKGASDLGRLRLLLELIDLPPLPHRLTVHGVLEPFDHGFKVLNAFRQDLKTRPVLVAAGIGGKSRFLSARAKLNHHAFEHPR